MKSPSLRRIAARVWPRYVPCLLLLGICGTANPARADDPALPPDVSALCVDGQCSAAIVLTTFAGHVAYRLTDGHSAAVVVPDTGRVMSFEKVGGPDWLWHPAVRPTPKAGQWTNYGGNKTWLAPQASWAAFHGKNAWPPDMAFDGDAFAATVLTGGHLRLDSRLSATGIKLSREFYFDANGDFVISQTARKVTGGPLMASLWSVTQTTGADAYYLPLNPQSPYRGGFYRFGTGPTPGVHVVSPALAEYTPGTPIKQGYKMGFDVPVSALAIVRGRTALIEHSRHGSGDYPDGASGAGFPVELFVNQDPAAPYVETELLAPLRLFTVGTRWVSTVRWSFATLPPVKEGKEVRYRAIEALLGLSSKS